MESGSATAHPRKGYPFGAPDGTPQEGAHDPLQNFVRVGGKQFARGLGMDEHDRTVRVIVGRKGAGKTLYLRRLQRAAQDDRSLYADSWQTDHPPTGEVIRMYDLAIGKGNVTELWERIWRRALMRAVASHLLCARRLKAASEPLAQELRSTLAQLDCSFGRPSAPSHQVEEIIFGRNYLEAIESYLDRPAWRTLESVIDQALADVPPICFYLDALDENFERAPKQWLACQLGLARTVLRLVNTFPRLHVVIAIRDLVYSALLRSEHRTKFVRMDRIRTLDWNYAAIERLLEVKITQLHPDYVLGPADAGTSIERWLGVTQIMNLGRSKDRAGRGEDAKTYLLRHTRLIPRDLVQLGNAICDITDEASDSDVDYLTNEALCHAVSRVARDAGHEELLIVANHITTNWMPRGSVDMGIEASFVPSDRPNDEYTLQHHVRDHLRRLLRDLKEDRVTQSRFVQFLDVARADFGDFDLASILWQHGLVGYIEGPRKTGRPVFYSATDENEMVLSAEHAAYALHPIMIDAVPLMGVGEVVRAF